MKSKLLLVFISGMMLCATMQASAQTCSAPNNDQTAFHDSPNYWYAYFYRNADFTNYHGRVRYASSTNPDFDVDFGNSYYMTVWNFFTPGNFNCALTTSSFSVRARMWRNVGTATTYDFTVGADDGVRLYIDGNLVIDEWVSQGYTTHTITYRLTPGRHEFVLEYYEDEDDNRLSFEMNASSCQNTTYTPVYGTGTWWNAYFFDGKNFETYRRTVTNYGNPVTPAFDINFGGSNVNLTGGGCSLNTETFSVRFMLTHYFPAGWYLFTVGGDDGFRLSLDGGATWVIDRWTDQAYTIATRVVQIPVAGNRNMILEFYENHGENRISFDYGVTLPVSIIQFNGKQNNGASTLSWQTTPESTEDRFVVERSANGRDFDPVGEVKASTAVAAPNGNRQYHFTDRNAPVGSSFYRLKIIDRNGPEKYSAIVNIHSKDQPIAKIYPTIINQNKQLFIQTSQSAGNLEVAIRNISGQQILAKKLGQMARGQIATLPLQDVPLSKGTYMVQVLADGAVLHKQLIILP